MAHARAALLHQRHVPDELDDIAHSLLGGDQDGLARLGQPFQHLHDQQRRAYQRNRQRDHGKASPVDVRTLVHDGIIRRRRRKFRDSHIAQRAWRIKKIGRDGND